MKYLKVEPWKYLLDFMLVFLILILPAGNIRAEAPQDLSDCSQIEDNEQRLECYDKTAESEQDKTAKASYLTRLWELDKEVPRGKYSFMPHRSNYILPFAYNDLLF